MEKKVLLVSTIDQVRRGASAIATQLGVEVEVASGRKEALAALREGEFVVVVIEESLAEADPSWADQVWHSATPAVPLEVNFAITARDRLVRAIRGALARQDQEIKLAWRQAEVAFGNEFKGSVTGLLLETQLALKAPGVSPELAPKLQHLVELASCIRERLRYGA